jgi:hypothetical protein
MPINYFEQRRSQGVSARGDLSIASCAAANLLRVDSTHLTQNTFLLKTKLRVLVETESVTRRAMAAEQRPTRQTLEYVKKVLTRLAVVPSSSSYGTGFFKYLSGEGAEVVEVTRQNRRRRGKSDPVDAEAAARAALNGEITGAPKFQDGVVESIRALRVAFTSARDARTRAALQIRDLLVNAPHALCAEIEPLSTEHRVARCVRFRPGDPFDPRGWTGAGCMLAPNQLWHHDEARREAEEEPQQVHVEGVEARVRLSIRRL